jgi:hypothetical protein
MYEFIALMMEAVCISEMPFYFNETTSQKAVIFIFAVVRT